MSVADVDLTLTVEYNWREMDYVLILKRPSFAAEGEFVAYVRQRAVSGAEVIPDSVTRKEALSAYLGELACGKYDWEHDIASGEENYIKEALKSSQGLKRWMFIILHQNTPFFNCSDGKLLFDELWKDQDKRGEVLAKVEALFAKNPQTPPVGKLPVPKGAEPVSVESGATSKSNQS